MIAGVKPCGWNIVVVDDGSTDATAAVLQRTPAVTVITFPVNQGKGAALRSAFAHVHSRGYTHAVTIDADGQHLTVDLLLLHEKMREEPETLWIGNRILLAPGSEEQPLRSRFGRRFGAFWYRFSTGNRIADTQCGLRVYPLAGIMTTGCRGDRYEYEIEVLILAAWRGIAVKSVPVHLHYQSREQRVSHFRPIRDFLRISTVNSRAAIARIFIPKQLRNAPGLSIREKIGKLIYHELRANSSPVKASQSLAWGVFMGIVPLHGFQVVTLMGLTVLLRLNRPLAFLGVNVSIAPLLPFWIAAGVGVGRSILPSSVAAPLATVFELVLPNAVKTWVLGLPVQGFFEGVVQWFFGSMVLAVLCGLLTFGICLPVFGAIIARRKTGGRRNVEIDT